MFGVSRIALSSVLSLHLSARVKGLIGFKVFGGVARIVVGHYVLHKYSARALIPLPLVRQRIARSQRLEQLVPQNIHRAVTEPVKTVAMIERIILAFAQVGANVVGFVQYLVGSQRRHDSLDDSMVVTRSAEVIAPTVGASHVAVELCGSAPYDVG